MPSPFRLSTDGDALRLDTGDELNSTTSIDIVEDESRDLNERLRTAVHSVLNGLQDDISEDLRTAWPSLDGRTMAIPYVHSDGEWVHMWFGDKEAPVLSIPAIPIAEITEAEGENFSAV